METFRKAWFKENTCIFLSVYRYWETSCWITFNLTVNQHYEALPSLSELMLANNCRIHSQRVIAWSCWGARASHRPQLHLHTYLSKCRELNLSGFNQLNGERHTLIEMYCILIKVTSIFLNTHHPQHFSLVKIIPPCYPFLRFSKIKTRGKRAAGIHIMSCCCRYFSELTAKQRQN